jgi:2-polyprenyl-3-methyl-5-hydroxy-6-metoxy-1,4-benzoquinol methylase
MQYKSRTNQPNSLDVVDMKENPLAIAMNLARYHFAASLLHPQDQVVDAACGLGYGSNLLARTCAQVVGLDNDPSAILCGQTRYQDQQNLTFDQVDLEKHLAFGDWFETGHADVIVSLDTIEHLWHVPEFMTNVVEALTEPQSMFICGTPRKQSLAIRNAAHVQEYTPGNFYTLMERCFHRVLRFGQNETIISSLFNQETCWYLFAVCTGAKAP